MSIALLVIATGGERYTKFVRPLLESAREYFPVHHPIVFTDSDEAFGAIQVHQENLGWPRATLMRYHAFQRSQELLRKFDYLFYCDVDMLFVNKIEPEEICADGITATLHPGFPQTFERGAASTAYVAGDHPYYQGCFVGGRTDRFLAMCEEIAICIDADDANGVMAVWHDESHLNRYLVDHPPAKVLTPAFAYPAEKYLVTPEKWQKHGWVPKISHLEKLDQGTWKDSEFVAG